MGTAMGWAHPYHMGGTLSQVDVDCVRMCITQPSIDNLLQERDVLQ